MHIRIHTNSRPFLCPYKEICSKSFKTRSQLSDHLLKHTKIKKFTCPVCKISFSRKSRLKIHMMIHKGEMPFQCSICQKRFRERSNLNFHIKKHKSNEMIKKKLFKNVKKYKNNKRNLNSKKKVINVKKVDNKIKENNNFGICTLINSNNNCDYNNNYTDNGKEETNKLDNIIEMKLNIINNCINDNINNFIDFNENNIINFDKNKDINKESFINTNEYEYDGKSNIYNKENGLDDIDNFIINNNNELIEFSDIEISENQISCSQKEETNLKAFPANLWDTFEDINRFV